MPDERAAAELELDKVLEIVARRAVTPMGATHLKQMPILAEVSTILAQQQKVTDMRRLYDDGQTLSLDVFPDLRDVFSALKLPGAALPAKDLAGLARMAGMARQIRSFCRSVRDSYPALWESVAEISPVRPFEQAVGRAIDPASFEILDTASPALRRIRKEMESARQKVRQHLEAILHKAAARDLLQEELITMREGRLVLMVKDEFRQKIEGVVHDQSASGQTLFIEPVKSVELNNRVRRLQAEERAEIERILAMLTDEARQVQDALSENNRLLIALDAVQAMALYSRDFNCSPPLLRASGVLSLLRARHPLLLEKYGDAGKVIPLDLEIGKHHACLVITGPNAGGKTVALKTVGLCVLLARMGLHIPASPDSEIGLLSKLYVDIGDQQSIENDLSTFTSHMMRLREMVDQAGRNDLILIDEMGSGTDPEEGIALALAVLHHFLERGTCCIVTTHYGALKAFAHETDGVENGSMVFDNATLLPTYRFRPGIPGSSYAFEIAARTGLREELIADARGFVGREKGRVEILIADLEAKIQEQERRIRDLKLEETRLSGLAKLYKERADRLAANERALKQKAIEESEAILARANAAIEETVRSIREQQAEKEVIRAAKAKIQAEKSQLEAAREKILAETRTQETGADAALALQPGEAVYWKTQRQHATILEPPDAESRVQIQVGSLKLKVPVRELEAAPANKKSSAHVSVFKPPKVAQEIDLRGMRAEDAVAAVDRYLADALLYGWEQVRLIHGKGTGALRKAIADFLATHPNVATYGAAAPGKGDIGVTEVTFK